MKLSADYKYQYTFTLKDGRKYDFDIAISEESIDLIFPERNSYPQWTLLDNHKCPNCPLDSVKEKYCPMAVSIIDVVEAFKDVFSFEEVEVTVQSNERTFYKKGAIQEGLSSIMGLYMAASGCPNLTKLKPMAATHLPFSSVDETIYRILSMHALAQLLKNRTTCTIDSEFVELKELYANISIVNSKFCQRLSQFKQRDANVNAVVILNNFAEFVPFSIKEEVISSRFVKAAGKGYVSGN